MSPTSRLTPGQRARARAAIGRVRAITERLPAPIADRVRDEARNTRNRRRDQRRAELGDDGAYFDDVVNRAISEAQP